MLQRLEKLAGGIYRESELGAWTAYKFFVTLVWVYSGIAFTVWLLSGGQFMALITISTLTGTVANVGAICARRRWKFHQALNRLTRPTGPYDTYH